MADSPRELEIRVQADFEPAELAGEDFRQQLEEEMRVEAERAVPIRETTGRTLAEALAGKSGAPEEPSRPSEAAGEEPLTEAGEAIGAFREAIARFADAVDEMRSATEDLGEAADDAAQDEPSPNPPLPPGDSDQQEAKSGGLGAFLFGRLSTSLLSMVGAVIGLRQAFRFLSDGTGDLIGGFKEASTKAAELDPGVAFAQARAQVALFERDLRAARAAAPEIIEQLNRIADRAQEEVEVRIRAERFVTEAEKQAALTEARETGEGARQIFQILLQGLFQSLRNIISSLGTQPPVEITPREPGEGPPPPPEPGPDLQSRVREQIDQLDLLGDLDEGGPERPPGPRGQPISQISTQETRREAIDERGPQVPPPLAAQERPASESTLRELVAATREMARRFRGSEPVARGLPGGPEDPESPTRKAFDQLMQEAGLA